LGVIDAYRGPGAGVRRHPPAPASVGAFGVSVGTAGCFLGVSRALRAKLPAVHRVVVEPAESAVLSGGPPGTHHIEGGGIGRCPPLLHHEDFDEVIAVPEADAFAMARAATTHEAVFSRPSTGASLVAAVQLAARLGEGHRVVTVQVDSGLKYLAGDIYNPMTKED